MKQLAIISMLLMSAFCYAQAQRTFPIWEGFEDITPGDRLGASELTVYLPDEDKNTGIAVIVCPGGAYYYLDTEFEGHDVGRWLQENGITAFVLRYRVGVFGNHHPAMLKDLQRAIQLVRENHELWKGDPDKIGVLGFSAGGHMAGCAATYFDMNFMAILDVHTYVSLRPDFVGMVYPIVSMEDSLTHKGAREALFGDGNFDRLKRMLSLECRVHKYMPPVFLADFKDDKLLDYRNSVVYKEALDRAGVPCEMHIYENGGHGFGLHPKDPNADGHAWGGEFLKWVFKTVGKKE